VAEALATREGKVSQVYDLFRNGDAFEMITQSEGSCDVHEIGSQRRIGQTRTAVKGPDDVGDAVGYDDAGQCGAAVKAQVGNPAETFIERGTLQGGAGVKSPGFNVGQTGRHDYRRDSGVVEGAGRDVL